MSSLSALPPLAYGTLECLQDGIVRLPEDRRIHREVDRVCTALVRVYEHPASAQGSQEPSHVYTRVERHRGDVGAVWEAPYPHPIALVEASHEVCAPGH